MDDCGLMLEPQEGMSVDEIVSWANYAENSGYGFIFRSDHLKPTSGVTKKLPSPECWVTLGAVAARTNRIKFGPMVSPIGFRNPAILASIACTLHSYSKGRAILSVGAGWYQAEYEAFGINFPELQRRKEEFHEALQIMRPLTEGKQVAFRGKYYSANTECLPKPDPKIHFVIGGKNSDIIRWSAHFADELNMYSPSKKTIARAKRILAEEGRKEDDFILSQMAPFFIGESDADLKKRVQGYLNENGLQVKVEDQISDFKEAGIFCGTPDDFAAQVKEKRTSGLGRFYFQLIDPTDREAAEILTKTLRKI
jgi:alkanesulfonate monooxygenase SsuD/methylene tetrahydromethanopterin reductase-like flavin-dependent oxidoreductase (luciferase family)